MLTSVFIFPLQWTLEVKKLLASLLWLTKAWQWTKSCQWYSPTPREFKVLGCAIAWGLAQDWSGLQCTLLSWRFYGMMHCFQDDRAYGSSFTSHPISSYRIWLYHVILTWKILTSNLPHIVPYQVYTCKYLEKIVKAANLVSLEKRVEI